MKENRWFHCLNSVRNIVESQLGKFHEKDQNQVCL